MAKLDRVFQKLFGKDGASSNFGEFGSLALGSPVTTKDPALMQSLAPFLTGWQDATIGDRRPAFQDMNSAFYVAFYQICYMLQMGIAEWDTSTEYVANSFAQYNGILYQSLLASNSGNAPDSSPTYWTRVIDVATQVQTGVTQPYAGRTAPTGYLMCDGSAVSRSTYAALFAVAVPSLGAFTVTIATPAVLTLASHGLVAGEAVYFTTTGALPTGLSANTLYYVIAAGLTTDNFEVSATRGGAAINTSGSQSGVHTLRACPYGLGNGSTTFNLPSIPGRAVVGYSAGDANFGYLGQLSGEATHILTENEMPAHHHTVACNTGAAGSGISGGDSGNKDTSTVGGGAAHNNVQPSIAMNFIIKT